MNNKEYWKFTIRVYTPREVFHERQTYFKRHANGDIWLKLHLLDWAVLFGWSKFSKAMPFFLLVTRKDNET